MDRKSEITLQKLCIPTGDSNQCEIISCLCGGHRGINKFPYLPDGISHRSVQKSNSNSHTQ